MATIAEQLTSLADTKTAIKDAIVAKGVSVADTDTFASYATKIGEISGGGGSSSKYGLSLDSLLGNVVGGVLQSKSFLPTSRLVFSGATTLDTRSLDHAFTFYTKIESVSFPDLIEVKSSAAEYAFQNNNNVTSVDLGNLETVDTQGLQYFMSSSGGAEDTTIVGLEKIKTIGNSGMSNFGAGHRFVLADEAPFSMLESVGDSGLYYAFGDGSSLDDGSTVGDIDFKNLTTVGSSGMASMFRFCKINSFKANSIVVVDSSNAFNYTCAGSKGLSVLEFKSLQSVSGTNAFGSFVAGAEHQLVNLEFPELDTVSGSSAFEKFLARSTASITQRILLPKLKTVSGNNAFRYFHSSSTGAPTTGVASALVQLDLHSLQTVSGSSAFYYSFSGHNLYHIDLGNLETASGQSCFYGAFHQGSSSETAATLMSVDFSCLKTIGNQAFHKAFENNVSLPRITFPSLTSVHIGSFAPSNTNTTNDAFKGCTGLTEIHFLMSMQSTISGLYGYSRNFGATNATIYFDLVGAITVNGVVYNRSEADSLRQEDAIRTKTHIAWADESGNLVYTASFRDTQEPYVGTEVYSSDGYTQVGTVEAIA